MKFLTDKEQKINTLYKNCWFAKEWETAGKSYWDLVYYRLATLDDYEEYHY